MGSIGEVSGKFFTAEDRPMVGAVSDHCRYVVVGVRSKQVRARFKFYEEARHHADQLNSNAPQMATIINEQVIELDPDVVALIAATFNRDADTIFAQPETWTKVRSIFPASLAPELDEKGETNVKLQAQS